MADAAAGQPGIQRRRSERISKFLPLIVRGIDLLGQPFEERTSTLTVNLHGCRYASKHHLPKNTWVTLEVPEGSERRHVRARVAWIQRPHSVREFFQIAVEMESPANLWGVAPPPSDWALIEPPPNPPQEGLREQDWQTAAAPPFIAADEYSEGKSTQAMTNPHSEFTPEVPTSPESSPLSDSPLWRQWSDELDRQAVHAADAAAERAAAPIHQAIDDFRKLETSARENLSALIEARQQEFVAALKAEFDRAFQQTRDLMQELDRAAGALRMESQAAQDASSRMAESLLQIEAAEAARAQSAESAKQALSDTDAAVWRRRLDAEMSLAQAQWDELLQSSLDSSLGRLVEQLSGRSQDLLRIAEYKISERLAELQQPLGQIHFEASASLSSIRSALEEELGRAKASLAEIEQAATRLTEHSAQFEAASRDWISGLQQRFDTILQSQTDELHRRAERLFAGTLQRLEPALDSLGRHVLDRTASEMDAKLAPSLDRASELLRALASREAEADETLRLHRERLRQLGEAHLREVGAQTAATLASLRDDLDSARRDALAKWSEELDAVSARASHAAAESMGRSSEWFQQEARERLQVLVEQSVGTASAAFEERTGEASRQFEARLEEQSSARVVQIHEQLDGVAAELTGRTQTQIERAAEAAAASFGQVLRNISEKETGAFIANSRSALAERENEFGRAVDQLLQNLEASGQESLGRFRSQMASHLDASVSDGRNALAGELASSLESYRAERDTHQKNWTEELQRLSADAAAKHHDRLQSASDTWVVSSMRRLNEYGQDAVDALMRQADQNLRDSFAKFFEGLSGMLRERPAGAPVGFAPSPAQEMDSAPAPHNDAATGATA